MKVQWHDRDHGLNAPMITVDNRVIDYGPINMEGSHASLIFLKNVGSVPSKWHFVDAEEMKSVSPWLHFSALSGVIEVGEEQFITATVNGNKLYAELTPQNKNNPDKVPHFETRLLLRVEGGGEFCCIIGGFMGSYNDDSEDTMLDVAQDMIELDEGQPVHLTRCAEEERAELYPVAVGISYTRVLLSIAKRFSAVPGEATPSSRRTAAHYRDVMRATSRAGFI